LLATFAITCLAAPLAAAIAATWAGAVGDASAAVIGKAWRRARGGDGKTLAGSAACLLATAGGAWWLAGFTAPMAVVLGLVAASVERPAVALDDNVRVTAGTALAAVLLLQR
jgi:dolichol kinase